MPSAARTAAQSPASSGSTRSAGRSRAWTGGAGPPGSAGQCTASAGANGILVITAYRSRASRKISSTYAAGSLAANHARSGPSRAPGVAPAPAASRSMAPRPSSCSTLTTPQHASDSGVRLTKSSSKMSSACRSFGHAKNSSVPGGAPGRRTESASPSAASSGSTMKSSATR